MPPSPGHSGSQRQVPNTTPRVQIMATHISTQFQEAQRSCVVLTHYLDWILLFVVAGCAWGGELSGVADSFIGGFWWLDQLGQLATEGVVTQHRHTVFAYTPQVRQQANPALNSWPFVGIIGRSARDERRQWHALPHSVPTGVMEPS